MSEEKGLTGAQVKKQVDAAVAFLNVEWTKGETALSAMAKYVVDTIFAGDAAAALTGPDDNPVWVALHARTRSPAFKLDRPTLDFARKLGAFDELIAHQGWAGLNVTRKRLLLPLGSETALLKGALHATRMNLDETGIRKYVLANMPKKEKNGRSQPRPTVRGVAKAAFVFAAFDDEVQQERFARKASALKAAQRRDLRADLERSRAALDALLARLDA